GYGLSIWHSPSCAVPTRQRPEQITQGRVGTAYERLSQHEPQCHRLCPPYRANFGARDRYLLSDFAGALPAARPLRLVVCPMMPSKCLSKSPGMIRGSQVGEQV